MTNQNTDIVKLKAWMTPAEALRLVTCDNARLLTLSGLRNPCPGNRWKPTATGTGWPPTSLAIPTNSPSM